jgi:hypothetical protein
MLNINVKLEEPPNILKTSSNSSPGVDMSIHVIKLPWISRETVPLKRHRDLFWPAGTLTVRELVRKKRKQKSGLLNSKEINLISEAVRQIFYSVFEAWKLNFVPLYSFFLCASYKISMIFFLLLRGPLYFRTLSWSTLRLPLLSSPPTARK